jgi:transcription-repair coupling factor (superfamily II helicase)
MDHRLSAAAEKRLTVMQTLDSLGAGFTLASHDLDIRGAGNLLGDEQSGHIREVGIELYQQMLEDAVADVRAGDGKRTGQERDWTPNISLGLPVLIPETYVRDLPVRLGLYRRIGALASDGETDAMAAELVDRFGKLPDEVDNLLGVVALKRACREVGVEKVEAGPKGMVVTFRGNAFANPAGLVRWLQGKGGLVRLRPDHKLAILQDMDVLTRLKTAKDLLSALARIKKQTQPA